MNFGIDTMIDMQAILIIAIESIDMQAIIKIAIESIVKILPTLTAAYFAYRLWVDKSAKEQADEVIRGAIILKYFSRELSRNLPFDPKGSELSIEVLYSHMSSVLITETLSDRFLVVTDIYSQWKLKEYFPSNKDNNDKIEVCQKNLQECQNACETVISNIRSLSIKELSRRLQNSDFGGASPASSASLAETLTDKGGLPESSEAP
jgi:hypothetical protein